MNKKRKGVKGPASGFLGGKEVAALTSRGAV